ncbi:hypothetical protein ACHQM5_001613 [Ranunculus cassubicifolius]
MALVVRGSIAPSRSNSIPLPRVFPAKISTQIISNGRSGLEGTLKSSLIKIFKHASEVRGVLESERVSYLPVDLDENSPTGPSLLSEPNGSCTATWGSSHLQRGSDYDSINLQHLFSIQRTLLLSNTTKAVLMANALLFIMPFEALAETCETGGSFSMPGLLIVALIGATVGGLVARQRKGELQRLNTQLRQINAALRRQAKIESYAPTLSYAPVGGRIAEDDVIVDSRKNDLITKLKSGKNLLRNQAPEKAFMEFKTALELAREVKEPLEEKKAARGLGASLQRQGKYKEAINYHSLVLTISERVGESSGNTEAYGAIADCYTELGDLEKAATYYDKYIATLESD